MLSNEMRMELSRVSRSRTEEARLAALGDLPRPGKPV